MGPLLRAQWDRMAAWVAAALGALLLLIGYVKVSGTAFPAEQIPYLVSAGLGALFLLGIAGTLWISADLRDEYAKLAEIARALEAPQGQQGEQAASAVAAPPARPAPEPAQAARVADLDLAPRRTSRRTSRTTRTSSADTGARPATPTMSMPPVPDAGREQRAC